MYFSGNSDRNDVKEGDPVLLLLSTPLELSATVSPVRLALSDVDFDPDDCVIHHWQPIAHYLPGQTIEEAGNVISIKLIPVGLSQIFFLRRVKC